MKADSDRLSQLRSVALVAILLSHWRLVAAALGIAVASLGQFVITSGRAFDWPILNPLWDEIFGYLSKQPSSLALGLLLLLVGGAMFAGSIPPERQRDDIETERTGPRALAAEPRNIKMWVFGGMIVLGLAISAILWLQLALGNYAYGYPFLWGAGIAVVAGALLYLDRRSGADLRPRIGLLEVAFLIMATGAFIAINLVDLMNWYYTVIGDEYSIFQRTVPVAEGVSANFFSLHGAYDQLPMAESYYRAAVMKVFGIDYFGWKFASVLAGAAVLAPMYFLVRNRVNIPAAVAAVVLLAASHMMLAYAHTGYSALSALFPTVLAFALFFSALKRGSIVLMFGAGVVAGLGFYVLPNARILFPILLLVLFVYGSRLNLKLNLPLLVLGFVLAVMPMAIVANTDIITLAADQSVFNYDPGIVPDPWDRIKDNALRSPLAFNFNGAKQHFVSGSLLEPITAVLAVLGLAYALMRFTRPTFFLFLVWYAVAMVTTGILSPHGAVPVGRMSYLITVVVLFAGLAIGQGYVLVRDFTKTVTTNNVLIAAVPALVLVILLAGVVGSNLYRFWHVTPNNLPSGQDAIVMKAALLSECRDHDRQTVAVVRSGSLPLAFSTWDWGRDRVPVILDYTEIERVTEYAPTSCVIYNPTNDFPFAQDLARLRQLTGASVVTSEYDNSGQRRVMVLR